MAPPSDLAIARERRVLLGVARAHAKDETLPPSAIDAAVYGQARGGHMMVPIVADALEAYEGQRLASPLSAFDLAAAE